MNPIDLIEYADRSMERAIDSLEPDDWATVVAGVWDAKDVLGHMAVSHARTAAVLEGFAAGSPPDHDPHDDEGEAFNRSEAERRSGWPVDRVVAEYREAAARLRTAAGSIDASAWPIVGSLAWYPTYSLDDLVAYRIYGHVRHHGTHLLMAADIGRAARGG